ncbi:hypothetical protein [Mesoaciditoga lauensis]|uniref:hypothetical protein n=1 Tax=Mesoaciditoga lauensis TaxID=1495039 RepID=UPI00055A3111|nr:hypothetical protein [Mesoaciditoga lauensis]
MKFDHINEKMTLKEIMERNPLLESELFKLGFNACCSKMSSLESFAKDNQIDVKKAVEDLNEKIDEVNKISELLEEQS